MTMRTERRQRAWDRTEGRCFYCGCALIEDDLMALDGLSPIRAGLRCMQVDHILARAVGGTDEPENLIAACDICNSEKGARSIEEYRLAKGLKNRRMPYRFAFDEPGALVERDFLFVLTQAPAVASASQAYMRR